jgi:hypothetical protein
VSDENDQPKTRSHLTEIAITYFEKKGFKIKYENATVEGNSGTSHHFDLIIEKNENSRGEQGVWIRDWNRTIGVNVIINLDTTSEDSRLSTPILVGEKFSGHAKAYANRNRRVELLTKQDIERFR